MVAREDRRRSGACACGAGELAHVGHVSLNDKNAHVLLVTLNKQGKADGHRYRDHWIDEHHFHGQSQNQTTPTSKRGQEIIEHEARGIVIHLFVRDAKLAGGKAAVRVSRPGVVPVTRGERADERGVQSSMRGCCLRSGGEEQRAASAPLRSFDIDARDGH
ncbi:MAG: DUF3427 domain-containing protein [Burkholderiales bacterium]